MGGSGVRSIVRHEFSIFKRMDAATVPLKTHRMAGPKLSKTTPSSEIAKKITLGLEQWAKDHVARGGVSSIEYIKKYQYLNILKKSLGADGFFKYPSRVGKTIGAMVGIIEKRPGGADELVITDHIAKFFLWGVEHWLYDNRFNFSSNDKEKAYKMNVIKTIPDDIFGRYFGIVVKFRFNNYTYAYMRVHHKYFNLLDNYGYGHSCIEPQHMARFISELPSSKGEISLKILKEHKTHYRTLIERLHQLL